MYLKHFELDTKPFQITADPKFLWLGEKHKEALATLRYGIMDNRGFLLMTGDVGTGKTLLVNRLMNLLDQDTLVATLPDPDLTNMDFYNLLADGFRMNRTFESKGAFLIHLRDFLYQNHANNKRVLLIIDECQRLKHHLMEDIRILSNIELHDRKLINIFFVGQQEFNALLSDPRNRALTQRITVRYHIPPLEKQEVAKYIFHRLRVAGGTRKIFTPAALEQIFYFSGGIPRLINILCDHALLTGYARGARQVDERIIRECADELRIPMQSTGFEEIGSLRAPDSKSIAVAAARSEQAKTVPPAAASAARNAGSAAAPPGPEKTLPNTLVRMVLYAGIILVLMFMAGFAITRFSDEERAIRHSGLQVPKRYRADNTTAPLAAAAKAPQREKADRAADPDPSPVPQGGENEGHPTGSADVGTNGTLHKINTDGAKASPGPVLGEVAPLPLIREKVVIPFALNSNQIDSDSHALLDRIAIYLAEHPDQYIKVRGYTDSSGDPRYNEEVSRLRAEAVKSYLLEKGVPGSQVQTYAMGILMPVATNETAEGRARNRRVEIEFEDLLPEDRG